MHSLALVALAVHTLFLVPLFPQACYAIPQDVQTTTSATGALPSSTIVTSASSALPVTSDTSSARGTASSSADASQTTASPMTTPATPQLPLSTLKEIWTIQSRRVDAIIGALDSPSQVPQWSVCFECSQPSVTFDIGRRLWVPMGDGLIPKLTIPLHVMQGVQTGLPRTIG